jgi:diguanylate cyclase
MTNLKREATTDALTGLFNWKAFNTRLKQALSEANIDGCPVSVLMLDVDHFKRVNDTYGHHTGDLVLRLIGRLLSESIKGRDTSARYGGEEFAVLLVGADLKAGATAANQIRLALERKGLVEKRSSSDAVSITVSVGVAQFRPNETATSLLERADAAMYQAKHRGNNQVYASQEISGQEW